MSDWFFSSFPRTTYLAETGPWWAAVVWLAALGGCVGSFLNVVALRTPAGEDIVVAGSRCPCCRHRLAWWQNLPLLGWPLLGGRCHYCRAPIPIRYWLWELAFAALAVGIGLATPWL